MLKFIPEKHQVFVLPFFTIVIVLVSSLTLGRVLVSKIFGALDSRTQLSDQNRQLQAKKNFLESLDKNLLTSQADQLSKAIPASVPTLPALSAIRHIGVTRNIIISNFRVSENTGDQSSKVVNLEVDFAGNLTNTFAFLDDLQKSTPLMRVTNVDITTAANSSANSKVRVTAYWQPYPTSLSSLSEPLNPLSSADQDVIKSLSGLTSPPGGQFTPFPPQGKDNPFKF